MLKWLVGLAIAASLGTAAEARQYRRTVQPAFCFIVCPSAATAYVRPARAYRHRPRAGRAARRAQVAAVKRSARVDKPRVVSVKRKGRFCKAAPGHSLTRLAHISLLDVFDSDLQRWKAWMNHAAGGPAPDLRFMIEYAVAKVYLVMTVKQPGATMIRQGIAKSLECIQPVFAVRLMKTIRTARENGFPHAGISSACRPPELGVGGFADKFMSGHPYGIAVDFSGIGRPGSKEARRFQEIAGANKVYNPYGYRHRAEWNHYQPTMLRAVTKRMPLRSTITRRGPVSLDVTWRAGTPYILDKVVDVVTPRAHSRRSRVAGMVRRRAA